MPGVQQRPGGGDDVAHRMLRIPAIKAEVVFLAELVGQAGPGLDE
jgi:hypothetical protein